VEAAFVEVEAAFFENGKVLAAARFPRWKVSFPEQQLSSPCLLLPVEQQYFPADAGEHCVILEVPAAFRLY
jgi:hypothetical protein